MNLQSSTLKDDETGEPLHVQQRKQIEAYREAYKEAGHAREPCVSVSRSIFPLTDDLDRACFGRDRNSRDQVGMIDDTTRAIFGRSYAAEPDVLVKQLREDEAIEAADTLLLTIPNQLGVDHNVHVMESILTHCSRHAPTRQVEVLVTVSGPEELKTWLMQHAEASAAQRASWPPDAYRALLGMATRAAPGFDRRREDLHRFARP